ncbi:MAG: NAD(P)/FAD-dependent oxidoreductase [Cyanobacteria bacterium QH_9_48_43]|nr:MAG: NAD(P)/FAD-dependent oxidoreductase [Cyanobacteria bacterium QH_9_48_43]
MYLNFHTTPRKNTIPPPALGGNVTPNQICILGGGFAGLYTALYLNRLSWSKCKKPQITIIDKENRFLFTPFLYELVTREFQSWEIAPSFEKLLADTGIQFHQGTIQGIDLEKRQVQLHRGEIFSYDYLVLAVGRETLSDLVSGAATYAYPFRTLADADLLRERLRVLEATDLPKIQVAIAGGGPGGVELAGKLADRLQERGQIYLFARDKQILKNFSAFSQKVARQSLEARGVQVKFETSIDSVSSNQINLVHQGQVRTISVDLAIGTLGTQSKEWLRPLDCQHNSQNQLLTLPTLQLVNYPEVFALGDLADIRDAQGKQVPSTAQAAFQQANCAARNLGAALTGRPLLAFRYSHLGEMLTLGINDAIVSSFGINLRGSIACAIRRWVYILLRMPTCRHRLQVVKHRLKRLILDWLVSHRQQSTAKSYWRKSKY